MDKVNELNCFRLQSTIRHNQKLQELTAQLDEKTGGRCVLRKKHNTLKGQYFMSPKIDRPDNGGQPRTGSQEDRRKSGESRV